MKKPRFNLSLFFIIIILFITLLILGSFFRLLRTADYFQVKDILISQNNTIDLTYLKGKNIFSIDLQKESTYITQYYPIYRTVRLVRVIPNRIFVDFIRRRPLAIIKLYRYFLVDGEGVVFDLQPELDYSDLPIILGLETKIFGPKSGKIYNVKELLFALDIIRELKNNHILKDYPLKIMNVAELNNVPLQLAGLEIKMAADNLEEKINILSSLLTQDKNSLTNIKYIDLRFKEPVIKLKNVK